jgi:hypothetical protein
MKRYCQVKSPLTSRLGLGFTQFGIQCVTQWLSIHVPSQSHANFLRDHKIMTEKYGVTVTSEWANENSLSK